MPNHIFVSYSRQDTLIMKKVRSDLETACFKVWTDEGIEVGTQSWKEAIEQAIRDAQVMVVLLSPDANDSKWVQREIDFAELQGKPILPMLVRGKERDAIPFALSGAQFIDVRKQYAKGIKKLIERVAINMELDDVTLPAKQSHGRTLGAVAFLMTAIIALVGVILFGAYRTSIQDYFNSNAGTVAAQARSEVNVLLRYNNQSLVLHNPNQRSVSIDGIGFTLYETTNEPIHTFSSNEWTRITLAAAQCTQVWASEVGFLDGMLIPADICDVRVSYFSTFRTFWLSDTPNSAFTVQRGGVLLGMCPALPTNSDDIVTCELDIPILTTANP